jgi:hypothetical protein
MIAMLRLFRIYKKTAHKRGILRDTRAGIHMNELSIDALIALSQWRRSLWLENLQSQKLRILFCIGIKSRTDDFAWPRALDRRILTAQCAGGRHNLQQSKNSRKKR